MVLLIYCYPLVIKNALVSQKWSSAVSLPGSRRLLLAVTSCSPGSCGLHHLKIELGLTLAARALVFASTAAAHRPPLTPSPCQNHAFHTCPRL